MLIKDKHTRQCLQFSLFDNCLVWSLGINETIDRNRNIQQCDFFCVVCQGSVFLSFQVC